MNFDFNIAGITVGFQVYPDATTSFYDQFYDGSKDDWKLAIQRINEEIRYTYLRYNLFSGENRGGSFIGFSLIFNGIYCTNVQRLLKLFNAVYEEQLKENKLIGYNEGGKPKFVVKDFKNASTQIALIKQVFKTNLTEHFEKDFAKYDTSFLISDLSKAYKVGSDISENELLEKLKQYAFVEISSSRITKGEERVITEKDLLYLEHLPEKVVEKSKSFAQRWQDISTQMGTLSQLPHNRQIEKKPILYSLFSTLKTDIAEPFAFLFNDISIAQTLLKSNPNHTLFSAYFQKLTKRIDAEAQALKSIKNSMANVEDVIDTYKINNSDRGKAVVPKVNYNAKKIIVVVPVILFFLAGLYYFFPKQNKQYDDTIKDTLVKEKIQPSEPQQTQMPTDEELYSKYVGLAGENMSKKKYKKAIERADSALYFKPNDPVAMTIKDAATKALSPQKSPVVIINQPRQADKAKTSKPLNTKKVPQKPNNEIRDLIKQKPKN